MAYCTQEDLVNQIEEALLKQLTDDAGADEIDEDIVARAIADADATIDSYCQGRYSVPLSPVPEKIRELSVDIAVYNLYSRRGRVVPEVRKDRHQAAVRFLERVAEGKIALGAATPAPANTENSATVVSAPRVFSRRKLRGF